MNVKNLAIVCFAALLIFGLAAWSNTDPDSSEPRTVSVTGDAEVRVVPDEVILTLGVETWNKNLEIAKGENDRIISSVLELAANYGIEPQHIQTDFVSIEPRYQNGYHEQRDFIGYFVRKSIVLTLRDLTQFEDVLSESLAAGVNYVQGIEFRTTELRAHKDQARALAIQAAKEKASALAGELDQKIGAPLYIQEEQSGWHSSYGTWWGWRWGNAVAQNVVQELSSSGTVGDEYLAPGQISVQARVSVSFELP